MRYRVAPFTSDDIPAVKAFNLRLASSNTTSRFPENPIPSWLPPGAESPLHQEFYLVHDDKGVRGGYILKPQDFMLCGKLTRIGYFSLPISEGLIDSSHAIVGLLTAKDALRRSPLLFGLGMGSVHEPIAKLLRTLKFKMVPCPFFFRVNHPFRFCRNISFLRSSHTRKALLDTLAFTGLGWIGIHTLQQFRNNRMISGDFTKAEEILEFDSWCNHIWERAHERYSLIAVRNDVVLRALYPSDKSHFIKIRITQDDTAIGWAVLLNTPMKHHRQFGDMRVGSIVDALSVPGKESSVVRHATEILQRGGTDILISNQLHRSWLQAFAHNGYLQGPSNYIFAVSSRLASHLEPFNVRSSQIHMTRGDGDGPIHLR